MYKATNVLNWESSGSSVHFVSQVQIQFNHTNEQLRGQLAAHLVLSQPEGRLCAVLIALIASSPHCFLAS